MCLGLYLNWKSIDIGCGFESHQSHLCITHSSGVMELNKLKGDDFLGNFRVAGIQHGTTKKDNKPYTVLHLLEAFEKPEQGIGSRVSQEFIFNDIDLSQIQPGMTVNIDYNKGFDGKAYVSNVSVVPTKANNSK